MATLPRLAVDQVDMFMAEFVEREQPVVLTGAPRLATSVEELVRRIVSDPASEQKRLWINVGPDVLDDIIDVPAAVTRLLDPEMSFVRTAHVRAWFTPAGHLTPLHYDANSLEVFNLHLRGTKRWRLIGPARGIKCVPFMEVGLPGQRPDVEDVLEAGDLLFLPRYWAHEVESIDDVNVGVNWVRTPRVPGSVSRHARRESETLWWKWRFPWLLPPIMREQVRTYAGSGQPAVDAYTSEVSAIDAATRLAREVGGVPRAVLAARRLKQIKSMELSQRAAQEDLIADLSP